MFAALSAWQPAVAEQGGAGPTDRATEAALARLGSFNTAMRRHYGEGRTVLARAARPVILLAGDEAILLSADRRERKSYTPQIYQILKSGSHVVLGLTGVMAPILDGLSPDTDWREGLRRVDAEIAGLQPLVPEMGLNEAQAARQARMLAAARAYIAAELPKTAPDRKAFVDLMVALKPLWLADAADATEAQLQALHRVVSGWRREMDPAEWDRLHVVVTGARPARVNNVQMQYFLRLLGERDPGGRVIFTESLFAPEQAMDLYAATIADRALSALVFSDPYRMEKDLLGYAAGSILDRLIPGTGTD